MKPSLALACLLSPLVLGLVGCKSTYYGAWEQFGVHKRDILVDRVEDARKEQAGAQEQFKTTLEAFQELTGFDGGELKKVYGNLNSEYEKAEKRAAAVRKRIDSIESVSSDLFREWETEIDEITSQSIKEQSRGMLEDTQARYETLIGKMNTAAAQMDPVLATFKDQVLILKHNLNAQAIDSLRATSLEIEQDVEELIRNMQVSIDEADAFIASMSS